MSAQDVILPPAATATGISRSRIAAFVPLALALVGVAVVLLGGVSARSTDTASVTNVDPITTGSIMTPEQRRHALEMLDN
jgi:hypothetical protein